MSEIKLIENRLQLQYNLAQILAGGGELEATVHSYLKALLDFNDWQAAVLWTPSQDHDKLIVIGSIHDNHSESLTEFIQKNNAQKIKRGDGAVGQVWVTRHHLWSFNPSVDAVVTQELQPTHSPIKTNVAYPLLSGDNCVGVLELFSFQKIIPGTGAINDLLACANQMGQFLERKQCERNFIRQENVHTSCFTRDITERKAVEENLIESEKRFRMIADATPVFIWIADTDTLFTYFNKLWLKFRGKSFQEEQGHGWQEGVHPEDLKKCIDHYLDAYEKQAPIRLEFRLRRADGIYRWILNTGTPNFSDNGIFLGYVGSGIDITDLKFTEEQRRHSQKMETIGRLAGGVAHDFNNLLTAINGFSELAIGLVKEEGNLKDFLHEIKKSGEQAAILTQQLLAYSRKQILTPMLVNLNLTVLEMDRMLKRVIGEDIELNTILAPNLSLVQADGNQLQQIILNLVINAKDAMPNGGRLLLETSNVVLTENYVSSHWDSKPGPHVLLAVTDNGIGMDTDTKTRIFEPFFTTKEIGKGTGLGLASVYGIIKQSGGSILVYSEPGQGTTFKIYLPAISSENVKTPAEAEIIQANLHGSETVLIVEDDETVRKFIHQTLSDFGYTVFNSKDGAEALIALKRKVPIDLVLTDVIMPGINGRQLANQVLSLRPEMKILFMSGYTENAIAHNGILDTDVVFLQKPFGQTELVKMIRGVFDKAANQKN